MMTRGFGPARPIVTVLLLAIATLALAACGGEDPTPTPEPTAAEQPGATPTQAAQPSPTASTSASSGESGTRTVEHAMGTTEVPADPQRVVVLDMGEMDMALALGVQPVGAALYNPDQEFAGYLQPRIDGYTRVGTVSEPDLEAVAALDPDLIISNKTRHEDIYDELSRIAPTVFAEALGADWKPQFETVARALGREDRHAEVMGEYWERIDQFQEAMGERLDETHVTVVRSFPDHVRLYMKDSFIGTIIEDAGLPRPEPQDKDKFMEEVSAERTRDLAADVIFKLYWSPSQGEQLSQITDNPLWDRLAAVEAGQVYEMDDEVWGTGLGPMAAMEVIEDLRGVLVEDSVDSSVWAPDEAAAFPVTIEHKYGSATIDERPERVVTIGYSEQDPVLAMGVKPVAVREWFGGQPNAVWPWAQDELGDGDPEVLSMAFGELDFEKIASLRPDLLVATHSGITEDEYERLSEIAPTLAQSGDHPDFGMPWQEQTRVIGRTLGKSERAERLVRNVEHKIADAKDAYPEFEEATVAWASPAETQGQYWAVGPSTPPMQFLSSLGFQMPGDLAEVVGDKDSAQISKEQVSLLDADVLIFQVSSEEAREAIENDPLYQKLDAAEEDRTIFFVGVDDPVYGALSFSTVLSLPFAVDELAPRLSEAVSGGTDRETAADPSAGFPVTIEHKYGSATIEEPPERVVALGFQEQDALLALGVKPVAVRYWFGDEPHAVFPWAQDELGDAEPEVLEMSSGELDFEKIAALDPDLISGVYSGITEEEYQKLSRIAPTITQTDEYVDFGMPWQEMTITVGRALGREEQGEQLVSDVEDRFEAARQDHPGWHGKSVVVGAPRGDGQFGFVASQDARARVFTSLGFEVPQEFDEIAGDEFWGTVSTERADLLDQDLVVFHQMQWVDGGREGILSDPLLSKLDAVQEGRVLFVEGEVDDALQFGTVLSLPFLLDDIVPRIEAAMDGDPDTEANP